MRAHDPGQQPAPRRISPGGRPFRDMALYERLISSGIAAADRRGGVVDHVTARRRSLWLLSRSQQPDFMRGLIRFARDGAITASLKKELRYYARYPGHPHQPQSARLLQYAVARGTDLGPIGTDFAGLCDQVDYADSLLTELHDRVTHGRIQPEQASPEAAGPQPVTLARHDPATGIVTLILDDSTASMAIHAISISATDREAHVREVQQYSQSLPENSYGRLNRQVIAARETRITTRLRAIEHAYRTAIDHDAAPALERFEIAAPVDRTPDRELELE